VALAIVAGLFLFMTVGLRWLEAPWSFELLGPTLTGTWEGPMQARLGARYRLYLVLEFNYRNGRGYKPLTGSGRICSQHRETYEYTLRGDADRSGNDVELNLTYGDPVRSALGMRLQGAWDGSTLTLRPRYNPFMPDGSFLLHRTVSTSEPDDSFEPAQLRRADLAAFEAACRRLGADRQPAAYSFAGETS